ncbi:MAG: OB-fold nucleic acid binding domain-containing protein [Candidatus Woesearchaeota archaeon]
MEIPQKDTQNPSESNAQSSSINQSNYSSNNSAQGNQQTIERQTAKICAISELQTGTYVKQEGWDPNYIKTRKGEAISRVNLVGVVVTVPESTQSVFIDDGTGRIEIRTYENDSLFTGLTIGDIVIVIGRPREYNGDIFVNAESIRKITNKGWLEYRKKEIQLKNILMPDVAEVKSDIPETIATPSTSAVSSEEVSDDELDEVDRVLVKVKELDTGTGCELQQLYEILPEAEGIMNRLLSNGDVYEISPGKVKVLE